MPPLLVLMLPTLTRTCIRHCIRKRVLAKFLEADCEKSDRLVELVIKYAEKVEAADAEHDRLGDAGA